MADLIFLVNVSFKTYTWQRNRFSELKPSLTLRNLLEFDSRQYVTWRTKTELAFLTHLSECVTPPVIERERLSGSVGPYAVHRDG